MRSCSFQVAFSSRFSSKQLIQEYPVEQDQDMQKNEFDEDERARTSSAGSATTPYGAMANQDLGVPRNFE